MSASGLTILLPDGDPYGIKIIEVANWAGKAFVVPRAKLKNVKDRPETQKPAIYFLFGENQETLKPSVYIGETENAYQRLVNHDGSKDFWNIAVIFTSNLDKADVRYLENKSVEEAKAAEHHTIMNGVGRNENLLSEFKKAAVDGYFDIMKTVIAILGYTVFEKLPERNQIITDQYSIRSDGIDAIGALLDSGEFLVFKASKIKQKNSPHFEKISANQIKEAMIIDGTLSPTDADSFIFTRDVPFSSPSQAADVVLGYSANGWIVWKDNQGKTLDENKRK